ncbi:Protein TRIGALACTOSYLDIACYLGLYCEROL 2, chloroplastic [Tetrabaena socialis]|uniref:Protein TRIGALACTOSYLDIACYLGLYCEROL 2, chloroplastic n=1 Tax=Tetrabaena socialis TaxID=47790 RepID=A0A2J8ABZ6_9CHLO|nr:Protein TRIGALACTOSYLDIACYLGLYCEROL 2, chloroplastic [Tetrabaena socialis]|eukprot:PNH10049.1 Protein TRIGALACTOSYLDIACYLGLYCEROL 2, chloroplastic [Tetrabaena socialis]
MAVAADAAAGVGSSGSSGDAVGGPSRQSFTGILRRAYVGEMLFIVVGGLICAGLAQWTVGTSLRRFNPYTFHVTLPLAPGVVKGTPLRMKGVPVGSVRSTTPLLHRVDVEVEVNDQKTIIPRVSKFELTQSGMIPASSIDITTPEGVSMEVLTAVVAAKARASAEASRSGGGGGAAGPRGASGDKGPGASKSGRAARVAKVRLASPKEVDACRLQDVLVCSGDTLDGLQGGSMDELMAHMLKTLRKGEAQAGGTGIVPGRGPVQN